MHVFHTEGQTDMGGWILKQDLVPNGRWHQNPLVSDNTFNCYDLQGREKGDQTCKEELEAISPKKCGQWQWKC